MKEVKMKTGLKSNIIKVCLMLGCCAGLITGCSTKSDKEVSIKSLADELKTKITYEDELSEIDKDAAVQIYNLDAIDIADCIAYISTGATPEEIVVISTNNATDALKVEELLKRRVEEQKESFRDYEPDELKKLDDAVVEEEGNTVVLSISKEEEKAEDIIDSFFKD